MKKSALIISLFASLVFAAACSKRPGTASRNSGAPQRLSTNDAGASEPAVAAGMDGTVYVVWIEHRGKDADVMLKRLNNTGESLSDPIRINPQPGQATAWRGDQPTIAIAPDGTVYVGWTGRAQAGSGTSPDIYLSASRDGGKVFAAPVKVNDDQRPNDHGMHSLAVASDGRVYVAWLDERNVEPEPAADMKMKGSSSGHHMESNRELFFSSSQDGGRSFSPNRSLAKDVCPCCKTKLAVGKDGRIYVSWRQVLPGDFRHIAVSSSSDQGSTFAKAAIVSDDEWVLKGCPVSGAALSVEADGTLRVLWYAGGDKGERGIYSAESRDGGQTFSSRQLVAAGAARGTPVLLRDRDHATTGVWQDGEGTQAQILTARFAAAITPKRLGTGELPAIAATNDQVFIVYVAGESGKQAIWLISAEKGKFESGG
jgi:hypothetical protein